MPVRVTIEEVIAETMYQGKVYEYRTVISHEGIRFGVFDPDMISSPDLIGQECEVEITPFMIEDIDTAGDASLGISPNRKNPLHWKYHTYTGDVTAIEADRTIVLDLGTGSVEIQYRPDEDTDFITSLHEDDRIQITTIRTDLKGIHRE